MSTPLSIERIAELKSCLAQGLQNQRYMLSSLVSEFNDLGAALDELVVVRAALGELVRLKDYKDELRMQGGDRDLIAAEYHRLKPLAWAAARAVLGRDAVQTGEGQQCET